MKTFVRALALAMLTVLAACAAVGPTYRPASPTELGAPATFQSGNPSVTEDLSVWWRRFSDPGLTELIDRALAGDQDISQAAARLRQAREALVQASAQRQPNLTIGQSSAYNLNHAAPDNRLYSDQIDAGWVTDLFGALRGGQQASQADLEASGFRLADVQASVAAEVARNYVSLRALRARISVARGSLENEDANLQIAGFRARAGLVSSIDVEQARAQRAQTAASIPTLVKSEAAARYRLAVLTGAAPGAIDALLAAEGPIPSAPPDIAVGIPADALRQRPDVRAAERGLAAATARIGVARAQLYPALKITADLTSSATSLARLNEVVTGGLFASISQTIFDGGALRSAVRARQAAAEESFAAYRSAVLGALEDVENALVSLQTAKSRTAELRLQTEASNHAAIFARSNYRAGVSDFTTLLEAERALLSARDGLAAAQGDEATAGIQLYLALGGGWTAHP